MFPHPGATLDFLVARLPAGFFLILWPQGLGQTP